ncbi:hypothetical protein BXZ70DRAFT_1010489 [Cristinia sonorae]|uniref:Uncharacterized protein n=1 Tax=Cristinia sonorae TaxID=1940300 RepID=A0A8K0UIF8_9AGAR|nr:hypothetical protein BXZ70DRAFT_1010489 [Cristinia sonorae]
MSRAAKATLALAVIATVAVVGGVHYMQKAEEARMYAGVLRDDERRREKQRQREFELQESLKKRALYESVQSVSTQSARRETS